MQDGRARFELDGESVDAPDGTFVHVQPGVTRTAFAEEPGTTLLAMGATLGKPYVVVGWEVWAQINPLYEAGRYAEAADRALEVYAALAREHQLVLLVEQVAPRDRGVGAVPRAGRQGLRLRPHPRPVRLPGARRREHLSPPRFEWKREQRKGRFPS